MENIAVIRDGEMRTVEGKEKIIQNIRRLLEEYPHEKVFFGLLLYGIRRRLDEGFTFLSSETAEAIIKVTDGFVDEMLRDLEIKHDLESEE